MHFSIPDTSALKDDGGTSYTVINYVKLKQQHSQKFGKMLFHVAITPIGLHDNCHANGKKNCHANGKKKNNNIKTSLNLIRLGKLKCGSII